MITSKLGLVCLGIMICSVFYTQNIFVKILGIFTICAFGLILFIDFINVQKARSSLEQQDAEDYIDYEMWLDDCGYLEDGLIACRSMPMRRHKK